MKISIPDTLWLTSAAVKSKIKGQQLNSDNHSYMYIFYGHLYFCIQAVCSNSLLSKFPRFGLVFKGWNKIPLVWSKFPAFGNEKVVGFEVKRKV